MDKFMIKLSACNTPENLERLHDYMRRTVPASQRREYIVLLDLREEVISRHLYQEKAYLE